MNNLAYYTYRIKWRLLMPFLKAKSFDTLSSILIFSEPRGGSTWLMEILSKLPKTAAIFEPFHSHYGAIDTYTWGNHYDKNDNWENGIKGIYDILNANKFDSYQLERSPWNKILSARQLVFKCVMATPILPWIVENFKLNYKPIFILRHPLAVASSTLENLYKREEKINVDHKWVPTGYNKKLYDKHSDLFAEDRPMMEQLIARWCINNHYILQQEQKWITIHYEQMLLEPQKTLSHIFREWDMAPPKDIFSDIDRPSHSDFTGDFRKDKNEQLLKWINKNTQGDLDRYQHILDRFEIDIYKMHQPLPANAGVSKIKLDRY